MRGDDLERDIEAVSLVAEVPEESILRGRTLGLSDLPLETGLTSVGTSSEEALVIRAEREQ